MLKLSVKIVCVWGLALGQMAQANAGAMVSKFASCFIVQPNVSYTLNDSDEMRVLLTHRVVDLSGERAIQEDLFRDGKLQHSFFRTMDGRRALMSKTFEDGGVNTFIVLQADPYPENLKAGEKYTLKETDSNDGEITQGGWKGTFVGFKTLILTLANGKKKQFDDVCYLREKSIAKDLNLIRHTWWVKDYGLIKSAIYRDGEKPYTSVLDGFEEKKE